MHGFPCDSDTDRIVTGDVSAFMWQLAKPDPIKSSAERPLSVWRRCGAMPNVDRQAVAEIRRIASGENSSLSTIVVTGGHTKPQRPNGRFS